MLESFKELFSSTAHTAAQRVKNPALGAFALSWCAFNWKSILYLLLSKTTIIDKITYITDNSTWKTVIGYPCLSVIVICGFLPWVNNLISIWQAKPIDNNESIENRRDARRIQRSTRLQRLQAKHDVTYKRLVTGAEKDIQEMKEQIVQSKASMGELTAERDTLQGQLFELERNYIEKSEDADRYYEESNNYQSIANEQNETIARQADEISRLNTSLNRIISDKDPVSVRARESEIARAMSNAAKGSYSPD